MSVELQTADKESLLDAIESLHLPFTINGNQTIIQTPNGNIIITDGKATLPQAAQVNLNQIKRAYSTKIVQRLAHKYKFIITNKENKTILRKY